MSNDITTVDGDTDDQGSDIRIPDVTIGKVLGKGGMASVYDGRQEFLNRAVAVKILHTDTFIGQEDRNREMIERFRREAQMLADLEHPNIVACYQAGVTESQQLFILMELIDGPTLREYVDEYDKVSELIALEIIRDVAKALDYAFQKGIIHRDIKPQNILLKSASGPGHREEFPYKAKLADLGLARIQHDRVEAKAEELTAAGSVMGTPSTMAPEQFDNPDEVDFRADIYGLGCVLYQLLTGERAFPQKAVSAIMKEKFKDTVPNPRDHCDSISEETAALCQRMLACDRNERWDDYESMIYSINDILGISETSNNQRLTSSVAAINQVPAKKSPTGLIAVIAVLLLAGIGIGAFVILGGGGSEDSPSNPIVSVDSDSSPASGVSEDIVADEVFEADLEDPELNESVSLPDEPQDRSDQLAEALSNASVFGQRNVDLVNESAKATPEPIAELPASYTTEPSFSLFELDEEERMDTWVEVTEGAFVPQTDGLGMLGFQSGSARNDIGAGPWKIGGVVKPIVLKEAAVAVVNEDGSESWTRIWRGNDRSLMVSVGGTDQSDEELFTVSPAAMVDFTAEVQPGEIVWTVTFEGETKQVSVSRDSLPQSLLLRHENANVVYPTLDYYSRVVEP